MGPSPGQEFAVSVAQLERLAALLPGVADALRKPIAVLTEHTPTTRPRQVAAVSRVERAYGTFTEDVVARQRTACDRIARLEDSDHR
jgi:hypothetical protein